MTTTTAPKSAYRELGLLAEGGMALVVQAVREADGASVVVKRVRPPLCFDASFVRLFLDEGALHARFDHDNIVRLVDSGEDEQGPFLVFEHVCGVDFAVLLEQARASGLPLDVELVLAVARPLVSALVSVHGACADGRCLDVVHRDISPGNVLLGDDGSVKLADFGVAASRLKTEQTVAGELKGKFAYMAPEQTRGERVTSSADLFAVGVLLWEALANRRLFDAATDADIVQQVRHREVPRLDDDGVAGARVEAPLADLVARLLHKDPAQRPSSASSVLSSLQEIIDARALEGLSRLVARAVRQAPRKDLTAIAPDVRRHTQRVVGLAGADTILRKPAKHRGRVVFGAVSAVAVVVVVGVVAQRTPAETVTPLPELPRVVVAAPPVPTPAFHRAPEPAVVAAIVDRAPVQATPPKTDKPKAPKPSSPSSSPSSSSSSSSSSSPSVATDGFGRLSLTSEPWGRVSVDGVVVAPETPLMGFTVAAGRHRVLVENPVLGLRKQLVVDVSKDGHERRFVDLTAP